MANSQSEDAAKTTTIVIDLATEERDAHVVENPKNIIHIAEYEQIKSLLKESLQEAKQCVDNYPCDEKPPMVRKHNTIMLAGVRGSGKTTFMLSILDHIRNGKFNIELPGDKHAECGIEPLPIFDPTLIEDKTHIFANIISMIKDKVYRKATKANCFNTDDSDLSRKFRNWEKSFRALAEGLPTVDGLGGDGFNTESWLDPEYVMKKGVSLANAANKLEESFHDFVQQSLKFLDKTAFILCFDDIDTNFRKGWPVLEVLRKYLSTPKLITILSGDLALYSILIKDQQWENFSDKLLQREYWSKFEREEGKNTVSHLVEQYLLKLLKAERRIFLDSLYRKGQKLGEKHIKVIGKNFEEDESLKSIYFELLRRKFGIYSNGQLETMYRFIASTPLRTQVQILSRYDELKVATDYELSNYFIDIFWTALNAKGIEVANLRNVPHYTVPQIVEYLVRNKLLVEGYSLIPNYSEHFVNSTQFVLGTLLTDRIRKDPSQIFEFWIRVCLTRELGALFDKDLNERQRGPTIDDYVESCAVTNLRTSRYVARFATAYIRGYLGYQSEAKTSEQKVSYSTGAWHGTLPLYGFASNKRLPNRIDYVLNKTNKNYFFRIMGYLPLSGATNHRGESLPVYSFYNLLGILGEIVLVARSAENEGDALREVRRTIVKNAQFREYPLPRWAQAVSLEDDQSVDIEGEDNVTDEEIESLSKSFALEMVDWAKQIEKNDAISPSIMAKAFTRFFYASNNMDKELAKDSNLGNWMHRMIIVFLNSILVVEAMEKINLTNAKLDLRNPVKKDDIFIGNLKKINDYNGSNVDRLILSRWILACPIWRVYMKDEFDLSPTYPEHGDNFDKFINLEISSEKQDMLCGLNELLDQVHIRTSEGSSMASKSGLSHRSKKTKLPSFSVNDRQAMIYLARKLKGMEFWPGTIQDYKPENLKALLRELLSEDFDVRSITINTAKSIIDHIAKQSYTW